MVVIDVMAVPSWHTKMLINWEEREWKWAPKSVSRESALQ